MRRRITLAILGTVAAALVLAGLGTLALTHVGARSSARSELEAQAQATALIATLRPNATRDTDGIEAHPQGAPDPHPRLARPRGRQPHRHRQQGRGAHRPRRSAASRVEPHLRADHQPAQGRDRVGLPRREHLRRFAPVGSHRQLPPGADVHPQRRPDARDRRPVVHPGIGGGAAPRSARGRSAQPPPHEAADRRHRGHRPHRRRRPLGAPARPRRQQHRRAGRLWRSRSTRWPTRWSGRAASSSSSCCRSRTTCARR